MESLAGASRILLILDMDSLGFIAEIMSLKIDQPPNKSPEPTAVLSVRSFGAKADGAVSSAVAVHVAGRRWLSFFR